MYVLLLFWDWGKGGGGVGRGVEGGGGAVGSERWTAQAGSTLPPPIRPRYNKTGGGGGLRGGGGGGVSTLNDFFIKKKKYKADPALSIPSSVIVVAAVCVCVRACVWWRGGGVRIS